MKKKLLAFAFAIIPAFVLSACNSEFEKEEEPLPTQEFTHLRDKIKPYTDSEQTTFVDFDGTELETQISRGSRVEFTKEEPTRKSSKKYDYKFKEWGQVFDKETKTTVVKAFYDKTVRKYTVDFVLPNGEKISSQKVEYGQLPEVNFEIPNEDNFIGFDHTLMPVSGNTTYRLEYNRAPGATYFSYGLVFERVIKDTPNYSTDEYSYDDYFVVKAYVGDEKNVIIPDTFEGLPIRRVLSGAFAGNNQITSIHFGKNVEYISEFAIFHNPAIEKFTVEEGNPYLILRDSALYQPNGYGSGYDLVAYPAASPNDEFEFPARTEDFDYLIHNGAFSDTNLEIIKFNTDLCGLNSIKYLFNDYGEETYEFTEKLRTVVITGGDINGELFDDMTTLESIVILENDEHPTCEVGAYAFKNCTGLEKIVLPDSVTDIGDYAFMNCSNLLDLKIGFTEMNINTIGEKIFSGCNKLRGATYNNIEYIGNEHRPYQIAYKADKKTSGLHFHADTKYVYDEICRGGLVENVSFAGNDLVGIGDKAFASCTQLTEISLPYSVTQIGMDSFYYLKSFCDESANEYRSIPSNGIDMPVNEDFYIYRRGSKGTAEYLGNPRFIDISAFYAANDYGKFSFDAECDSFALTGTNKQLLVGTRNGTLYAASQGTGTMDVGNSYMIYYIADNCFAYRNYTYINFKYNSYEQYIGDSAFAHMPNLKMPKLQYYNYDNVFAFNQCTYFGSYVFADAGGSESGYVYLYGKILTRIGTNAFKLANNKTMNVYMSGITELIENPAIWNNAPSWKTSYVNLVCGEYSAY